ncbi:glycosyltransferase family 4 protein [Hyphobacterium sp. CCMP332]|nr:glycosyltransferase family 4 protein [Hyphobacterium sp. CCMP332]
MPEPSYEGGMTMISLMYRDAGIFKRKGIHYFNTSFNHKNTISRFFESIILKWKFWQMLIKASVRDVYILSSSYTGFYDKILYVIIAKLLFKKTYLNLVGGAFFKFTNSGTFNRLMVPKLLKLPNAIVVGSELWKNKFKDLYGCENTRVIYNPVRIPDRFKNYNYSKNISARIEIVFLGALNEGKGVLDLIKIIQAFSAEESLIFTIIGKGEMESQISGDLEKEIALGRVKLEGFISEEEKHEILERAHVFILPSYFEVLPISILEAMYTGMLILSTKVGAIPEIIEENKNGFLYEPGQYNLMISGIQSLIQNPEMIEEIGRNNISKSKNFDVETIFEVQMNMMKNH